MWKTVISVLVLGLAASWFYNCCRFMGFHKTTYNHHPGPCKYIPDIDHGAEDMEWLPGNKVIMTTGVRLWERDNVHFADVRADVKIFDFDNPDKGVQPVTVKDFPGFEDCDFHGLSVYVDKKTGTIAVYIVNHEKSGSHVVEIFTYNERDNTLYHKDTVGRGDPYFGLLNDVVIVGPRQFYVSNMLWSGRLLEIVAQLKWSPITYWDGHKSHVASERRVLLGNGIATSVDGRYVLLADSFDRQILVFERQEDNSLELSQTFPIYMTPDNLIVDPETGDVWVACHVSAYQSFAFINNPKEGVSASKVIRIAFKDGELTEITEVFSDDGRFFSGSSVAMYRKNQLLIGSACYKALVCDVKYLPP